MIDPRRLSFELAELDRVFPAHVERAQILTMYDRDPEDRPDWDAFEAFVRANKRQRLSMPIGPLMRWEHRTIHGSFRRFAYFVPAILNACVAGDDPTPAGWPMRWMHAASWAASARSAEDIYHPEAPRGFTEEERRAMSAFFAAALRETVHGPHPDQGLEIIECAATFDAYPRDLIFAWLALVDADAEAALVEAVASCLSVPAFPLTYRALLDEAVRARFEERFLATSDPARAAALSGAEASVAALVGSR